MRHICSKIFVEYNLTKRINTRSIRLGVNQVKSQVEAGQNDTRSEGAKNSKQEGGTGERGSISKAMHSYLERAKEHNAFMQAQHEEFILGRRHLANMMGKDPENFSQSDINEAIRYLFPSGLFQVKARPMMKPPEEIYPKQKAAQFDASGRPHHPFFYTAKPNFFYLIHEIVNMISKMNTKVLSVESEPNSENESFINGTKWITKEQLEERLLEKLSDLQYSEWVNAMERVLSHRNFDKELEFVKSYRIPLSNQNVKQEFPPVLLESDGRKSVFIPRVGKKTARGNVTVRLPGTGIIKINGQELDYFKMIQSRELIIAPLQKVGMLKSVDVEAFMEGGGETSQAVGVRHGIAIGIAALGADVEPLRLAGYLTHDRRRKERSHVAHTGARAAWTWKKR